MRKTIVVAGARVAGAASALALHRRGAKVTVIDRVANEELAAEGIEMIVGETLDLSGVDELVVSPGFAPHHPLVVEALSRGIDVYSEPELAWRLRGPDAPKWLAITGTNGKTTTTAMVGHLLRALGLTAVDAGNIGTPLTEIALAATPPAWVSLEVSSFQLHDTPSIAPTVGVLTNLSPDHLDRYPSVEAYYADKALLFASASASSKWVLNADDRETERMVRSVAAAYPAAATPAGAAWPLRGALDFSLKHRAEAYYDRTSDELVVMGLPLLVRRKLALFGDHNVANALAASLAVMAADASHTTPASRAQIAAGLESFRALPHRLESVGEVGGVLWINDSKATNVSSTLVAIEGMTRPTVLLLGGRHKGEPYTALAEPLRRTGRAVIAYGEAGPIVARDLEGVVPLFQLGSDFEAVMAKARSLAQPGDVVLLSPACSSYDMFANYAERGATFRRLAMQGAGS